MITLRLLCFILTVTFSACTSFKALDVIDVSDIKVTKVSGDGAELEATLLIENPNGYKIKVTSIEAAILLNQKPAGKLSLSKKVTLQRKTATNYTFALTTKFSNLTPHIPSLLMGKELTLKLDGKLKGRIGLLSRKFPISLEKKISSNDLNLF